MKKIIPALSILLLTINCYATTVTVNPGGGADYTSLNAALLANEGVLSEPLIINCSGSTADTTQVASTSTDGYTTTATNNIQINGDNETGIYSTSYYRLEYAGTSGNDITFGNCDVVLNKIQIKHADHAFNYYSSLIQFNTTASKYLTVKNCILWSNSDTSYEYGITPNPAQYTGYELRCYNNIIYGLSGTGSVGIHIEHDAAGGHNWGADVILYGNTVFDGTTGIMTGDANYTYNTWVKNNAVFGCTLCFSGTANIDTGANNLSSDTTADDFGTGGIASATIDDTNDVMETAAGSEDLHLRTTADMVNAGVDLYADAKQAVTTDIDNDTISARTDIGADESGVAEPSGDFYQVIIMEN